MKAKAKCLINYSGTLYRAGDVFEVKEIDAEIMVPCVEPSAETQDAPEQEPHKRGRKRKEEE